MPVFCPVLDYLRKSCLGRLILICFLPAWQSILEEMTAKYLKQKKPKLNILELVFNSQGLPDWYLTNKYPLFNDRKDVVGLMGTVRPYGDGENKELKWERDDEIGRAVNHIRNNFRGEISISDLVEISGLSHRKLHRGSLSCLVLLRCNS